MANETPTHMRCVLGAGKRRVPEAVVAQDVRFGGIWEGAIGNGFHGLERSVIYMGGRMGYNTTHRDRYEGWRRGQGSRVWGTDDGGVRHSRGQNSKRETFKVPKRLAACLSEGSPRPGRVRGSLSLLTRRQVTLYQPLGAHSQLRVNVSLAEGHHTGSCGHKTTALSSATHSLWRGASGGQWKDTQVLGCISNTLLLSNIKCQKME